MKREWFRFQAKAEEPTVSDIFIYGDIGQSYWDDNAVSAKQFVDQLQALPDTVMTARARINSLGGNVFDGLAMANALREWARAKEGRVVETYNDGIAASAASIVLMGGTKVFVADNALVMLHDPYTCVCGNAREMRKMADALDVVRDGCVATYRWHSTLSASELVDLMAADTWLSADEAIAKGFATERVPEVTTAAASLSSPMLASMKVPDKFKAQFDAFVKPAAQPPAEEPKAMAPADVLAACEAGGCLELAKALIVENATVDQVTAKVAAEKSLRAQAKARADEVTAICVTAKLTPEMTKRLVDGALAVADVRALVTDMTALMDQARIDTGLGPDNGQDTGEAGWKNAFARVQKNPFGSGARH